MLGKNPETMQVWGAACKSCVDPNTVEESQCGLKLNTKSWKWICFWLKVKKKWYEVIFQFKQMQKFYVLCARLERPT